MTIESDLKRIADALEILANNAKPTEPKTQAVEPPEPQTDEPKEEKTDTNVVTLEDLRARFQALSQKGKRKELLELLDAYGVKKLPDVPEDGYVELSKVLTKLEEAA
jgi:hypothetical protein